MITKVVLFIAIFLFSGSLSNAESLKRRVHRFCNENLIAHDPSDLQYWLSQMSDEALFDHYWSLRARVNASRNPTWEQLNQAAVDRVEMRLIENMAKDQL